QVVAVDEVGAGSLDRAGQLVPRLGRAAQIDPFVEQLVAPPVPRPQRPPPEREREMERARPRPQAPGGLERPDAGLAVQEEDAHQPPRLRTTRAGFPPTTA